MKTELTPPPFPADAPFDEHALVIDESLLRRSRADMVLNRPEPVYTLESMVRNSERSITIVVGSVMNRSRKDRRKKHRHIIPERTEEGYAEFIGQVERMVFDERKGDKEDIRDSIRFMKFFRVGEGYVIDEQEKDNPITDRMQWYQKQMAYFFPLVPKVFFADKIGSAAALQANVMRTYRQQYREMLEQAAQKGVVLTNEEEGYLLERIQKITFTGRTNYRSKAGIKDDSKLVAAAYAVPADRVTVYSHDNDVKALVILTRHLAPERKVDMILMRR